MKICLLGPPQIEIDDSTVSLGRRKAVALLARLAVVSHPERRDSLATLLWPELPRARGLAALRRVLRTLTRALGHEVIQAERKTIGLDQAAVWVDVSEFRALARKIPKEEPETEQWNQILPDLTRASELWKGDFLQGFGLKDSPGFDEWQLYTSEELRGEMIRALQGCVSGFEQTGQRETAIEFAQRWLSMDNLSEEVHRKLMRLYALNGQRSRAIKQFEACVAVLQDELQVEPEAETRVLYESIRDGEFSPGGPASSSAPPIQVIHRLPEPPTPFIGRSTELARIMGRLKEPDCRLLTVVGPGGIGKTRLSLEAARAQFGEFAHGVCFVGLAPSTPALLVGSIAESLSLDIDPRGDPETQLLVFLREREMMLVLDNFEHLLERTDLVSSILSSCLKIKIIVTSRERLNLQGEWLFEIQGLEVPDEEHLEELEDYSAVRLFIQAARRVQPEFFLVDEDRPYLTRICSMVGGVPLGIELAAGWMRILGCREIVEQIENNLDFLTSTVRDLPERHRSLRAVFDSSLKLLRPVEQEVMAKLSVFKGSWTRQAAQAIAGASLPTLLSLVDKSLLRQSVSGRFEMHELIRQFAVELLEADEGKLTEIRNRHAEYYLESLSEQQERFKGEQTQTVDAIRKEFSNIRAAWQWASDHGMAELIERSVVSVYGFAFFSNWFREGAEMLEHASSSISKADHPRTWAKVTLRWSRLATRLGRFRQSQAPLEDCLKILRETGETDEIAFSLVSLSVIHSNRGEFAVARKLAEESGKLYRQVGNTHGVANTMVQLGRIIGQIGDYIKAKEYLEDAYSIFEEQGDQNGMARCLLNLGNCALLLGQAEESIRLQERCMEIFTRLGERKGVASALNNLGLIYEDLGDHQKAKELSLRGITLFRETGFHLGTAGGGVRLAPVFALENLGRATFSLGEFQESRRFFTEALQSAIGIDAMPQALLALLGLARLQLQDQHHVKGFELLTFIVHHPNLNNECRVQAVELIEETKSKITERQWRGAEKRGKRLKFEKLVEEALQNFDLRAPAM